MEINSQKEIHLVRAKDYHHEVDKLFLTEKIKRAEREIEGGKSLSQAEVEKLSQTWIKSNQLRCVNKKRK